jgi:hypothetical protein
MQIQIDDYIFRHIVLVMQIQIDDYICRHIVLVLILVSLRNESRKVNNLLQLLSAENPAVLQDS